MIKASPRALDDGQPSQPTVELLNSYLQVLKRKFGLLVQMLLYFSVGEAQQRHEEFFGIFEQLKRQERMVMTKLSAARDSSCVDKRTFERFCLRIYQQFQVATQKLKRIKLQCLAAGELTTTLQGILFESRSEYSVVNIGQFLLKVVSCEQTFKLQNIRKIYNLTKKTDVVLAEECKNLFKQELALKNSYDQEYAMPTDTGSQFDVTGLYLGMRHSLPMVTPSIPNDRTAEEVVQNRNSFNRQAFRKKPPLPDGMFPPRHSLAPDQKSYHLQVSITPPRHVRTCHHCECLKLLEVANIDDYSHDKEKQDDKILEQLLALNQRNIKDIDRFRRLARRAARAALGSQQRQQRNASVQHRQDDLVVEPISKLPPHPRTPEHNSLYENRPTSIGVIRKRANGTRSVMFNRDSSSTAEDEKKHESLKKIAEKVKKPSLAKLTEKKQELQLLRDAGNSKVSNSFIREPYQKELGHQPEDLFRPREVLALPRILRK